MVTCTKKFLKILKHKNLNLKVKLIMYNLDCTCFSEIEKPCSSHFGILVRFMQCCNDSNYLQTFATALLLQMPLLYLWYSLVGKMGSDVSDSLCSQSMLKKGTLMI